MHHPTRLHRRRGAAAGGSNRAERLAEQAGAPGRAVRAGRHTTDILARAPAPELRRVFGRPFVIERSAAVPDLPTIAEAGPLGGFEASSWFGLLAPAGTPPEIADVVNASGAKVD